MNKKKGEEKDDRLMNKTDDMDNTLMKKKNKMKL